jgi:hypothetical protein
MSEEEARVHQFREAVAPYLRERCELVGRFIRNDPETGFGDAGPFLELGESLYHSVLGRRAHRLPRSFLLALTTDEAHFLECSETGSEIEIRGEVLVLNRDDIRFIVGKDQILTLVATEGRHSHYIHVDREALNESGCAEVIATLSE